jgi:hypothetical protein
MLFGSVWSLSYRNRPGTRTNLISGKQVAAESRWIIAKYLKVLFMFSAPAVNGRLSPKRYTVAPVPYMPTFGSGKKPEYFWPCGEPGWRNMMKWRAYPGRGKALIAP